MKVAHIIGSLNVGGAERFVIDLSITQKQAGLFPEVISLGTEGEPLIQVCEENGIKAHVFPGSLIYKFFRTALVLNRFDVIHIHSPFALKFIRLAVPFIRGKIIYTRHGANPLPGEEWAKLHRAVKKHIHAVTFVSEESKMIFHENHQWLDVDSHVIDNGVIVAPVDKSRVESKLRIGSVGRMIPLKHQISLLQAVAVLPKELQAHIEVNFFGDGDCAELLKQYHQDHIKGVDVVFHGMVTERERIYSNIDLLVVTSETEGLSMVIIEAMANKIPVLATNVGGNPRLVKDDETGYLFEYDDVETLANLVSNLLNDDKQISTLGEQAYQYIKNTFSLDVTSQHYEKLYHN